MFMMVNKAKEYISSELMAHLYRSNADALMEENPEEKQRREEVLKMYETSKEALKIIGDINMNTHSEPPPPPIPASQDRITPARPRPAPTAPGSSGSGASGGSSSGGMEARRPPPRVPSKPAPAPAPRAPPRPSSGASRPVPPRPNIPGRPQVPNRP